MQGVPTGIDPALHLHGNGAAQNHIQAGTHDGHHRPAQQLPQAPEQRTLGQGQQIILGAQRKQHGQVDHPNSVFRGWQQGHNDATNQGGDAGAGGNHAQHRLAAGFPGQNQRRKHSVKGGGHQVHPGQEQNEIQNHPIFLQVLEPRPGLPEDAAASGLLRLLLGDPNEQRQHHESQQEAQQIAENHPIHPPEGKHGGG